MAKVEKLVPTEEEVSIAMERMSCWNPGIDYKSKNAEAKKEGHKDEKCPKCETTFLACIHFIKCAAEDCPMKSEDKRSLLQMMADKDNENGQS